MKDSNSLSTPMALKVLIDKDEQDIEIEISKYRVIIRSLLYVIASRPYIMSSVCMRV